MTIFIKRIFLLFVVSIACLFMVYLLIPEAAPVHAANVEIGQRQDTPTAIIVPTTVVTVTPTMTATVVSTPTPTATLAPTPTATLVPTTEPIPTPTDTATPTPSPTSTPIVGATPTPPTGGSTTTSGDHATLNAVIFTMGGAGMLLVVVGGILYFVYSRPV